MLRSSVPLLAMAGVWIGWHEPVETAKPSSVNVAPTTQQVVDQSIAIEIRADASVSAGLVLIGSLADAGTTARLNLEWEPVSNAVQRRSQATSLATGTHVEPMICSGGPGLRLCEGPERCTRCDRAVEKSRPATPRELKKNHSLVAEINSEIIPAKSVSAVREVNEDVRLFRSPEQSRQFFVQIGSRPQSEASYQPAAARLVAESKQVRIWSETFSADGAASARYEWFLHSLETEVLPGVRMLIGKIADVDGDGKLSICFTSRLDELPATESPVEGLVQANDFAPELPRPFSNQADVIFLSQRLRPGSHARTVMIHEAAHLAVFSHRRAAGAAGLRPEADWLNEGLAHVAETACGGDWSNLDRRLAAFARNPADAGLLVTDAQAQGLWRHAGSRAASWLFLTWLSDECGPRVIAELARRPGVGCEKLEAIVGRPFPKLFRRWSIALGRHSLGGPAGIHLAGFVESATDSRLSAGLRRGGAVHVWRLSRSQPRQEFVLRGTAMQGVHCQSPGRLRIRAPKEIALQITILQRTADGDRIRVIR